jgi:hypothetical protein
VSFFKKSCWACKGNGCVLNYAGIPIECPICDDPGSPYYGFSKKQYVKRQKEAFG